jgi:hypothetical protein
VYLYKYVCIYSCLCINMYTNISIHRYMDPYRHFKTDLGLECLSESTHYLYINICTYMCIYINVCTYIYSYLCINIYTNTYMHRYMDPYRHYKTDLGLQYLSEAMHYLHINTCIYIYVHTCVFI